MESVWSVSKLSTEFVGSRREGGEVAGDRLSTDRLLHWLHLTEFLLHLADNLTDTKSLNQRRSWDKIGQCRFVENTETVIAHRHCCCCCCLRCQRQPIQRVQTTADAVHWTKTWVPDIWRRELVANCVHTADATQLDSFVASAVCIGH